ncbi:S-adenosyl-L-methionine-dependent methyltransferase [Mycena alexandri]|uniref:S-adenosyl-L-methionine-dependent methyltransferase n=1 Tax=Mycena alexandri TaxID=1745969 RepID=A0AAD6XJ61_9AGAR|nr:S-adenosyl-L-methionine-dependent methyltransferase [Mycena alexandri]
MPPSPSVEAALDSSTDSQNFFKVEKYDEEYWDAYLTARPNYDDGRFYQRIYDYHKKHNPNPSWNLAHDVGTGPGNVAAQLATRFSKVVASDNNATHLAVAQHRLVQLSRVSFFQAASEDLADHFPNGSVDLVTAAECLPLVDAEVAVDGFARLLRPGGTLAAWFYGRPAFAASGPDAARCQALLDQTFSLAYQQVIRGGGPGAQQGWKRATTRLVSWLDDVGFPAAQWESVERWKWNTHALMCFYDPEVACDIPVERISYIDAARELVVEERDTNFWAARWDVAAVRRFLDVALPGFKAILETAEPEFGALFSQLEAAMGGPSAIHDITWPVVLILATRK